MRGGLVMNDKIMGLLKNLILNNIASTQIAKFCKKQQQSNIPSTNQQLLLPSVFLKDSEEIDEMICTLYRILVIKDNPTYKFTFNSSDPIQQNIIKTLQTKGIYYFDKIVSAVLAAGSLDIDILPLDGFVSSLKSLKNFGGIFISDKLIYSMFALSVRHLFIKREYKNTEEIIYNVDPIECPP